VANPSIENSQHLILSRASDGTICFVIALKSISISELMLK